LAAVAGGEPPKVAAVGAREVRGTNRIEPDSSSSGGPGLTVTLRVEGLDQPARSGRVVVTEAKDDTGADLKPELRSGGAGEPTEFPPATRRTGANTVEELPAFYARVPLKLPARQARKLASLKGEIRLVTGGGDKPKPIKIPGINTLYGKTVDHPDLARAGVTVQVAEHSEIEPLVLSVMISGRVPRDASVSVIDADGKSITAGGSGSVGDGAAYWQTHLKRPLRDSDALTVSVPVGQKPVTVPFELKDVELP
jgi:hypothetical protein